MQQLGFYPLLTEPCLYIRGPSTDRQYVSVYVDDQNIAAKTKEGIQQIKDEIAESFEITVSTGSGDFQGWR